MIETAPAKINLCLHVTGQREDGYHLLDSLVVFVDVADSIEAVPAETLDLVVTGPQAAGLSSGADNLVMRAARSFAVDRGARLTLTKVLPIASGIGGGSADAAAALRVLGRLWQMPLPDAAAQVRLGADVPVCLRGQAVRMQGIGEVLTPVAGLPEAWLVLANPGVEVATPAVFRALERKSNEGLPPVPGFATVIELAAWLAGRRNDLEPAAIGLAPVIGEVRRALAAQPGALLARMSGSGATCFGLFATRQSAEAAGDALHRAEPGWWVRSGRMLA